MVKKPSSGSSTSTAQNQDGRTKSQSHVNSNIASLKDEEKFRLGFQDCLSETLRFLIERKGMFAGDAFCVQLVQHLNVHCQLLSQNAVSIYLLFGFYDLQYFKLSLRK